MNKEIDVEKIRGLLHKVIGHTGDKHHSFCEACIDDLNQALSLLKPCSTCGGSGFVPENQGHNTIVDIPCPACQAPAGEVERLVDDVQELIDRKWCLEGNYIAWLKRKLLEACTHLTAQAKQIQQQYDKGWRDGSDAQDKADHEHIIKPLQIKNEQLMDDKNCKPCYGISCPHWPTCFPEMQTDIKELDDKIAQLEEGAFAANEESQARNDQIKQLEKEKKRLEHSLKCLENDYKRIHSRL